MFYRLYDTQTGCYMATGYNASSKEELKNDFISYKQGDAQDEFLEDVDIIDTILSDDFIIEESDIPFDEIENPLNQF